ncbi:hypothetical protein [Paracoccus thiocyanatus]|uniref:hypothetical protein n=1 Tax=Paracoccus thiocyanatus TaxID=34006 RepID=UPI00165F40B8|nr:hypothetical protein [Paracoccus thiocyanatus]
MIRQMDTTFRNVTLTISGMTDEWFLAYEAFAFQTVEDEVDDLGTGDGSQL